MRPKPARSTKSGGETIESFISNALFTMDLQHRFLTKAIGADVLRQHLPILLPGHFCAELAGVGYIGIWEQSGAMQGLPLALPTYPQACEALELQVRERPTSFFDDQPFGELFEKVLRASFVSQTFSKHLNCRFTSHCVDGDALVEALAQLLWSNRHVI